MLRLSQTTVTLPVGYCLATPSMKRIKSTAFRRSEHSPKSWPVCGLNAANSVRVPCRIYSNCFFARYAGSYGSLFDTRSRSGLPTFFLLSLMTSSLFGGGSLGPEIWRTVMYGRTMDRDSIRA